MVRPFPIRHLIISIAVWELTYLLYAGNQIDFMGNNITQVVLSFANTLGTSNDLAPQAAAILKKNLQPNKPLLISDLSDFANNLERLSKLDKISTAHSLNCFTAITGLYGSLLNIFEYEKGERAMEGGAVDAMCKGNGRPRMHCNGKVGLSVEYWRERRKMLSSGKGKERDVMMGGTGDQEVDEDAGDGKDKGRTWRIIIEIDEVGPECTSLDAVRTSEDWVGKGIAKPRYEPALGNVFRMDTNADDFFPVSSDDSMFGDDDFIIDWLDPEPSVENLMEVDSARPNARFIARLDPPIIVPLLEEVTIFSSLGLYSPPGQIGATTLDGLLFPRAVVPDPPPFTTERIIHLPPGMDSQNREHSDISTATHKYTLHTLKPIYAREVWEIPFGHPRQLGPILHIFRQYVLLATLLRSCFSLDYISSGTNTTTTTNTKTKPTNSKQSNHQQQPPPFPSHINPSNPFTFDDLDSFLASTSPSQLDSITATTTTTTTAITPPPSNSGPIPIDISLSSDPPSPTLKVIFPSKITYQRIISLEIEVLRNAILTARYTVVDSPEQVARNGGVEAGMGKGGLPGEDEVMKAVENTEDVGIVVEWLRRRV